MNQQERLNLILHHLEEAGQLTVEELCSLFGISKDTARRDIVKLEELELIERFWGGIRKPFLRPRLEDYRSRLITNSSVKRMLGEAAAKLVCNNDTVMLDLSATIQFVGESITANDVLVVTNSVDTAMALLHTKVAQVYLTGGYLYPQTHALLGMSVLDRVRDFHFNTVFIGATGVGPNGVYYTLQDDIVLKQMLMQNADKIVMVADQTKFYQTASFRMDFAGIHLFVTDARPPEDLMEVFHKNNIRVMLANGGDPIYLED